MGLEAAACGRRSREEGRHRREERRRPSSPSSSVRLRRPKPISVSPGGVGGAAGAGEARRHSPTHESVQLAEKEPHPESGFSLNHE